MKLIVSHNKPDFDALASLALARLVHPGAVAAVLGSLEGVMEAFVSLYRDVLELSPANDIEPDDVRELIVVDTSDPRRIAPFDALIGKVPITLYDHHPRSDASIPAAKGLHQPVGATASLLTLLLKAKHIDIPAELASLALLGIHEDTGHLSYTLTKAEDYEAAAHLLRSGASLALVEEFSREHYEPEHHALLTRLLQTVEEQTVNGHHVVTAMLETTNYVPGISPLANQLLDMHGADAALIAARMEDKTIVIARARDSCFDAGAALEEALAGGGHAGAAFARTDLDPAEALARVLSALTTHSHAAQTAKDLMSTPVKTVRESATVAEAQKKLLRFGHNGLPVLDAHDKLVGVISRRDLERALRHELGRPAVRGFMSKDVITAAETAGQRDLETLVEAHNIGRIPIMRDDKLVGIVTRTDLLAARHRKISPSPEEESIEQILVALAPAAKDVLEHAQTILNNDKGGALYLVGGTVRDALLKVGMQDLDVVVEGTTAERLAGELQRSLGGKLSCHFDFGTCTLALPSGLLVDIATAREEFYPYPGALPEVTPSTLKKDLARRDFTINALALRISPAPQRLFDPYGGLEDLEHHLLRSLHLLSFIEDPTRIIRGSRLAGRLGLRFSAQMAEQIEAALNPGILEHISKSRLRAELMLTLAETRVAPALEQLQACGALRAMFGLHADMERLQALDELRAQADIPDLSYLLILLLGLPEKQEDAHRQSFHWPKRLFEALAILRRIERKGSISESTLAQSTDALRAAVKALSPELWRQVDTFERVPQRQKLRGQDVLDLGLPPGPLVGEVLAKVTEARDKQQLSSFAEELELASKLVGGHLSNSDTDLDTDLDTA